MPLLDVSDVLDDPDFQTSITLLRTAVSGMERGRETTASTSTMMLAVVQPATSADLQRLPDASLNEGAITIWARWAFATDTATTKADKVVWRDDTYTVMTVDDWGEFGSGYFRAIAQRQSVP